MKKLLATLLVLCMVFTMIPMTAMAAEFSDMPNDYSTTALDNAVANGLLNGDEGKIMPDADLTRAQMAAIMVRALGTDGTADLSGFDDVDANAWYAGELGNAVKMALFQGDGALMRPNDAITRQEAFVVLARAFSMDTADLAVLDEYADKADIGDWAMTALAAMVEAGFVQGDDMGNINPTEKISRKDFAVVMDRMVAQYITAAGTYTEVGEGSVLVNTADVTLKDLTVSENLIVGDGVADGDVTLDNVTVDGEMIVRGGGINSIIIKGGSNIGTIKVVKVDGNIRIVIEDGAMVDIVYVNDGKDDVIIEGTVNKLVLSDDVPVKINDATVGTVSVEAENADVTLGAGTTVTTLDVTDTADGTSVEVEAGAEVETVNAAGEGTSVSGAGEVGTVEVTGNDVEVDTEGTKVNVAEGVTGTEAGGEAVEGGESVETPKTPSGGGGGSTPVTYKYNVSLPTVTGGKVTADVTGTDTPNTRVTLTFTADEGYALYNYRVKDPNDELLPKGREKKFTMDVEGTYTVEAMFIEPLTSIELLVIDSQADYNRLAAHANNEAAYPTDAQYTNLGTDPWLAVMLTRNENLVIDEINVPLNYMTFTRNGGTMTKPTEWDGASISSALSAYIGNAPAGDEGGHAFGQGTLSGTYKVEVGYMGATYTAEVMYAHEGETVYTVSFDLNGGTSNAPSDQIILDGGTVTVPSEVPTRDGYYFVGWYEEAAGTNKWEFTNDINHNTTLFAKWESSTVTNETELRAALAADAKTITVGADISLSDSIEIPLGTALTVTDGHTLTVTSGTFTNNGLVVGEVGSSLVAEQDVMLAGTGTYDIYGSATVYNFMTFILEELTYNMIGAEAKLLLTEDVDQNGVPFEHLGPNGLVKLDANATITLNNFRYTLQNGTATFGTLWLENLFTVDEGATLVVMDGETLTVGDTGSITNNGTLINNSTIRNAGKLEGTAPTGNGKVITVVRTADKLHAALTNSAVNNIEVVGVINPYVHDAYRIERELTIVGADAFAGITHDGSLDDEQGVVYMFAVRDEGNLTLIGLDLTVEAGDTKGTVVSVERDGQLTIDACTLTVNDSTASGISNGVFVQGYDPATQANGAAANTHAGAVEITNTTFAIEGANATAIGSQILNVTDFGEIFAPGSLSGNNYGNAYVFRQNDYVVAAGTTLDGWKTDSDALFDAQYALLKTGEKMVRYTLHSFEITNDAYSAWINTFDVFTKNSSGYTVEMSYVEAGDFVAAMANVSSLAAYTDATSVNLILSENTTISTDITIPANTTVTLPSDTTVTISAAVTGSGTIVGTDANSGLIISSEGSYGSLATAHYIWSRPNSQWVDIRYAD